EGAQGGDALPRAGDLVEGVAFGDLEDDPVQQLRMRLQILDQTIVPEILGVEVQEEGPGLVLGEGLEGAAADVVAEIAQAMEALCRVEHGARMGQGRLVAAEERLVAVQLAAIAGDDGLEGDPQGLEGPLEACLEGGPI